MKKIIFITSFLVSLNIFPQMKLNKGHDIDIFLDIAQNQNSKDGFCISNNSNKTYIIDPLGFYGESLVSINNVIQKPSTFWRGHYYRTNDEQCISDFIILKPNESIRINLNLANNDNAIYDYQKYQNYTKTIKSSHSRTTVLLHGCKSYVENLEKMGYFILEDSIDAKIHYTNQEVTKVE